MDRVRPGRVAIILGVLVGLFVAIGLPSMPDSLVGLVGGPTGVERYGGLQVRYKPDPSSDPDAARILAANTKIRRKGDVYVLEFPGVAEELSNEIVSMLGSGGLEFREVLESDYASKIGESDGVTLDVDPWTAEDGSRHAVPYLHGSREVLEQAVARAKAEGRLAPDVVIAFESVEPHRDSGDPSPYWRTYEVSPDAPLDGRHVADARMAFDPYSNRPIVLLDFTRDGARIFGDLTTRIVGRKLATMLGGRVKSAPIINSAIRGGRASITMGGSDPEHQEREAQMLAALLRTGQLPIGGTVEEATYVTPTKGGGAVKLARLLVGILVALGCGLIAFATIRFARPVWAAKTPRAEGKPPWLRLCVTLLAPAALILGSKVMLRGLDLDAVEGFTFSGTERYSVIALGITPILIAFVLVEIVALAVPPLRWRRHDPLGRIRLGQTVAALAIVLAIVQGYFMARSLEALSDFGPSMGSFRSMFTAEPSINIEPGFAFRISVMASLVGGTLGLAIVAGMIREHGLGNGYGALVLAGVVIDLVGPYVRTFAFRQLVPMDLPVVVTVALVALVTAVVLRWRVQADVREPAMRVPSSGITPLGDSLALVYLLLVLAAFGSSGDLFASISRAVQMIGSPIVFFVILLLTVPLWSWILARPKLVTPSPSRATWLGATALSIAMLVLIAAIQYVAMRIAPEPQRLVLAVTVMVATATVLDMIADFQAHRRPLAPVAVLHQIQRAGAVERRLTDAGIPCHVHAQHLRTLGAFFMPWAPAIVLVPEQHAVEARAKLSEQ